MTADELLVNAATEADDTSEQKVCRIDPETRQIILPEGMELLGVESDQETNRIYFECPKIVGDGIDLSERTIRINFQNAGNEPDQYIVTDLQHDDEKVYFSWLLSRSATMQRGITTFVVCAVKSSGGVIEDEWNTTIASGNVLQGLEATVVIPEEIKDIVLQLMEEAAASAKAASGSATAASQSATAASQSAGAASQKASDAISAASQAKGYTEQTKQLQTSAIGDVKFSIDPTRGCLVAEY